MKLWPLLTFGLIVVALSASASEPTLTPSELNAHADQYDGKKVRVRGWLIIEFEQYHFWDSKEASDRPFVPGQFPKECVSYLGPVRERTTGKTAILEGTFWKDFAKSLNAFDFGTCNVSGLDVNNSAPAAQSISK